MATTTIHCNNAYELSCSPTITTGSYTTFFIKPVNSISSNNSYRWGIIVGDGNSQTVFTVFEFHAGQLGYTNLGSRQLTLSWDGNTEIMTVTGSNWSGYSIISNYGPWYKVTS